VVVEVAARGGGYRIFSDILPAISGVDPVDAVIDLAMGRVPDVTPTRSRAAVLRFFNPRMTGPVQRIDGVAEARRLADVHDVVVEVKVGQKVGGITRDGERPGYIITVADTRNQALLAADRAEETVRFTIGAAEPETVSRGDGRPGDAP
jgi:biotin carboxylase